MLYYTYIMGGGFDFLEKFLPTVKKEECRSKK